MPLDKIGFFALLIQAFQETLADATTRLYPWAWYLFGAMVVLEIARVLATLAADDAKPVPALVGLALKILVVAFFLARWEYFFTLAVAQGRQLGLLAGGNRLTQAQFLSPGYYFEMGVTVGELLYQQWDRSTIVNIGQVVLSPVMTVGFFLAWVLFLIAFAALAMIILMVQVKIAFCVPAMLVILPFLVCKGTGWLAQGIMSYTARIAYHVFMLALVASIVFPVAKLITYQQQPDIRQALMFVIYALILLACFFFVPRMAHEIMSGVFTMGAGSLGQAALLSSTVLSTMSGTLAQIGNGVVGALRGLAGNVGGGGVSPVGTGSGAVPSMVVISMVPPSPPPQIYQQGLQAGGRYLLT